MLVQASAKFSKSGCAGFGVGCVIRVFSVLFLLLPAAKVQAASAYAFSTFAGAEHANVDGTGSGARFDAPAAWPLIAWEICMLPTRLITRFARSLREELSPRWLVLLESLGL
jgi:hypothetical protein